MSRLEEKRQAAQRLREQWQRDEDAGLHKRTPMGRSKPTPAASPAESDSKEEVDHTNDTQIPDAKVPEPIAEGHESDDSDDDDEEEEEDGVDTEADTKGKDENGTN